MGGPGHWKGLLVLFGVQGGEKQALMGEPATQPVALQQGICSSVSDSAASVFSFVKGGNSVSLPPCLGFGVDEGSSPEFFVGENIAGAVNCLLEVKVGPGRLPGGSLVLFS